MELPQTVRRALGKEAAQDLMTWFTEQLGKVRLSPKVRVTARVARQNVNLLVSDQVSGLFLSGTPTLVQKENGKKVWRVPVDLTFPRRGRVGRVGELEVDAYHGLVYVNDALLEQMAHQAQRLVDQLAEKTV